MGSGEKEVNVSPGKTSEKKKNQRENRGRYSKKRGKNFWGSKKRKLQRGLISQACVINLRERKNANQENLLCQGDEKKSRRQVAPREECPCVGEKKGGGKMP